MVGDTIRVGRVTYTLTFDMVTVHPATAWLLFGWLNPDVVHDACWDGEVIG